MLISRVNLVTKCVQYCIYLIAGQTAFFAKPALKIKTCVARVFIRDTNLRPDSRQLFDNYVWLTQIIMLHEIGVHSTQHVGSDEAAT